MNELITIFKSCLDILRNEENLTGGNALNNLTYILTLKLIEPHINKEIFFDTFDYDLDYITDINDRNEHKLKLLNIVKFSNLIIEQEYNLVTNIKYLWSDILSVHPATKSIFLSNKQFNIEKASSFIKLFKKINSIDVLNIEYDVLGSAYEEVVRDIETGKVFGQFFTQPSIKNLMIKLINPQINPDGTFETCADPAMGTGGFLISYLKQILKQSKEKNININWDFVKKNGLYGKELIEDTYQLAVSNMLISSGHIIENLELGNSIKNPTMKKFDNIIANPPFGVKGLNYNELKNSYIPIESDNAISLFIQIIINMLKINGKCAVVLPDGQDLFSKTNKNLIYVREYLLKTCDLKEIIYLQSGIFTYTNVKTCIFYFVKKMEGNQILNVEIKELKNKMKRTYIFSEVLQTENVKFYDYNHVNDTKTLLVEVSIDKIKNNTYSLNYSEYIEEEQKNYGDEIKIKTLDEICIFMKKSNHNASHGKKTGKYPFFKSSMNLNSFVDEADYNEECVIIGNGGEPNINFSNLFSVSNHCFVLKSKTDDVLIKYIYYYFLNNIDILKIYYKGATIKNISKDDLKKIKIPIPIIEKQIEIIQYCENNDNNIKQLENEIILNKKKAVKFLTDIITSKKPVEEIIVVKASKKIKKK